MKSLAHRVILAGGWQRRLIALVSGAVGALAMAPVNFFPAMLVPMTIAVWLLDGSAGRGRLTSMRSAAAIGWWWGFGYFLAGLWWLGSAFLVEPGGYEWALPIGVLGLPIILAFFPAAGFALARLLWSAGAGRILALAAALSFTEWLRGWVFTGFPWNSFGMALGGNLALAQIASIVGLDGLTLITVALAATPAALADGKRRAYPLLVAALALAAIAAFGAWRLATPEPGTVVGVKLRIMQPNLVEDAQFRADNKEAILSSYLALSDRAKSPTESGLANITHLIWPETALPTLLARDPESLAHIATALPPNVTLITGAFRLGEPQPGDPRTRYYNSIQVVAAGGQVVDSYDKVHLVPFGEYLPFESFFDRLGLAAMVRIPGHFQSGTLRRTLNVPGLPPAWPLICYEAIFPDAAMSPTDPSLPRPGFLLNVSNDSWFGLTAGPYQHLAQARLRSIEQGLPLVRAATTGLSAVVDSYGRIVAALPLGVRDVLDSPLPRSIGATYFALHGSLVAIGAWLLTLFGAILLRLWSSA
jgi:apolipoprotein N-acyltransferase